MRKFQKESDIDFSKLSYFEIIDDCLFSHAGLSKNFAKKSPIKLSKPTIYLSGLWDKDSLLWIRPNELIKDSYEINQIVSHTQILEDEQQFQVGENRITFVHSKNSQAIIYDTLTNNFKTIL